LKYWIAVYVMVLMFPHVFHIEFLAPGASAGKLTETTQLIKPWLQYVLNNQMSETCKQALH